VWRREGHRGREMRWSCQFIRSMFGIPGYSAVQRELLRALPKPTRTRGGKRAEWVHSLHRAAGRPTSAAAAPGSV
jgi:hypothetical protein